jgi:hypothetical protein
VSGNASRFLSIISNRLDVVIVVTVVVAGMYRVMLVFVFTDFPTWTRCKLEAAFLHVQTVLGLKVRVLRPSYTQTSETLISPSS